MILINLLPHREMARKKTRQEFKIALALSVITGAAIGGLIYLSFLNQIGNQEERNNFLVATNKKVDDEIKEIATLESEIDALKARQKAVEDLQGDRNLPVHMFNEIVREIPEGMYFNNISQEGKSVLLSGVAQSSERVAELLRNLSRNTEWVRQPELIEVVADHLSINKNEKRRVQKFIVCVQLGKADNSLEASEKK